MTFAASAANALWFASNLPAAVRFGQALAHCRELQSARLAALLAANADTRFGKTHGFSRIGSLMDYRSAVPVSTYPDYADCIDRIGDGERGVLTVAPVTHFGVTSGSGGPSKTIPYTEALKAEFAAGLAPWMVDLFARAPGLARGRAYWGISPALERSRTPCGIPVGFEEDAAYLGRMQHQLVSRVMAVPGVASRLGDPELFRHVTCAALLACDDLALVSIWHPSFFLMLIEWISSNWDGALRDLHDGVFDGAGQQVLAPNPARSKALARLVEPVPSTIWPHLRHVSCWTHSLAGAYVNRIAVLFPKAQIVPKGVIATEAFLTLPLKGCYPLAILSHFFEFELPGGDVLASWELEPGMECTPIVTTGGGLYRYRIADVLRVTDRIGTTPCFAFVAKSELISDLFGEKLHEAFVADCVRGLLDEFGAESGFALLAPEKDGESYGYVLFIQTRAQLPISVERDLECRLSASVHYALCRRLGQLKPVRVVRVGDGAYRAYVARLAQLNACRLGDIKPSCLSQLSDWSSMFERTPAVGSSVAGSSTERPVWRNSLRARENDA